MTGRVYQLFDVSASAPLPRFLQLASAAQWAAFLLTPSRHDARVQQRRFPTPRAPGFSPSRPAPRPRHRGRDEILVATVPLVAGALLRAPDVTWQAIGRPAEVEGQQRQKWQK
jgi:hypothetical protein